MARGLLLQLRMTKAPPGVDRQELFRDVVECAYDAILITDGEGEIQFANGCAERVLGYSTGELLGIGIETIIPQRFRQAHVQHRARFGESPVARPMHSGRVLYAQRKNGTEFPVEVALSPVGKSTFTTAILRDISAQKSEAVRQHLFGAVTGALTDSDAVRSIFDSVANLAVESFADWCVVDFQEGDRLERVVVVHRNPALQGLVSRFTAEQRRVPATRAGVLQCVQSGEGVCVAGLTPENLAARLTGEADPELLLALGLKSYLIVPLRARGRTFGAISFVSGTQDYGEGDLRFGEELGRRISLSVDNARLYASSQRSLKAREDTVAIVSHDLRGPLGSVLFGAGIMLRLLRSSAATLDDPTREALIRAAERMQKVARQGSELISDLLDFAKLESGTFELTREPTDIRSLLLEVIESFAHLAEQKDILFEVEVSETSRFAAADPGRLRQAVSNLVSNALKFTPEGGRVRVFLETRAEGLLVTVRDTGVGISAEALPHIFERYWQVAGGKRAGAGLGLSIAQGIVAAHGGNLWASSEPGAGSTFGFTLPLEAVARA